MFDHLFIASLGREFDVVRDTSDFRMFLTGLWDDLEESFLPETMSRINDGTDLANHATAKARAKLWLDAYLKRQDPDDEAITTDKFFGLIGMNYWAEYDEEEYSSTRKEVKAYLYSNISNYNPSFINAYQRKLSANKKRIIENLAKVANANDPSDLQTMNPAGPVEIETRAYCISRYVNGNNALLVLYAFLNDYDYEEQETREELWAKADAFFAGRRLAMYAMNFNYFDNSRDKLLRYTLRKGLSEQDFEDICQEIRNDFALSY